MNVDAPSQHLRAITRRHFFGECGVGVGKVALASLLCRSAMARPLAAAHAPHHAPRAKRVIYMFMAGAPSQLDMFDYKPVLARHEGQPIPAEIVKDQRYAFIRPDSTLLGARYKFARHGHSGAELSEIIPHLATVADELCIIKSMHTDQFNHAPAEIFLQTGSPLPGRPSMGSWVTYGLGSETQDLPAFVVLSTGGGASGGAASWSSGFLPTGYAGVPFRSQGDAILNVSNPPGVDARMQRDSLDLVGSLNRQRLETINDPEIATRISAYEMAYRLQTSAPELIDISKEPPEVLELYGAEPGKASFANNCLLARRMIERGVRYVNIYHHGWDAHSDVAGNLKNNCGITDKATAALIKDLKQRGLLDETLVVWGGEFGRTPMVETSAALGRSMGRDHHPQAFAVWMAGGGIKPGLTIGETDDLGFHITGDPVHIHDLQATILHLMGLDHERLTFEYQGRKFRLTDVHGKIVEQILA
jgi:hypothetical protein